jgi:putative ABC transport system substrate-binding protein
MQGAESNPVTMNLLEVLRRSLADLGWREGANLRLEVRWGNNNRDRTKAYAQELVDLKPDVIVAPATSLAPVREATRSIPIVFLLAGDPVGEGFISSLAHPGGNLTGFTYMDFSIGGKFVELLKEIAPGTTRVLVLVEADSRAAAKWWHSTESAARSLGVEPQQGPVHGPDDIDVAIHSFAATPNGGMIVPPASFFTANSARLVSLAARERLPAIYGTPPFAKDGGLLSYSVDATDQFMHAGYYVDRILKGDKPGDLPVQQPTKFELVVNLKAANGLGLTVPRSLLMSADEVIE